MKTHTTLKLLVAACAALVIGAIAAPFLHAGAMPLFAQAADAAPAAAAPGWLSTGLVSAVIALITGALAIWQNAEKKTAQKVSETLVLAIEQASQIPAVAEHEKKIKEKIQEVNERYHVEPLVNALVKKLT
ncbi:MAG: hypothetical protein LBC18_03245 [Opitutaceae bacterium]|nr:hypothetical protein [Opitutaceae bacterium]